MYHRIEIALKPNLPDPTGSKTKKMFQKAGWNQVQDIRTIESYTIKHHGIESSEQLSSLAEKLFVDPVLNVFSADELLADGLSFDWLVEVGFRAGVTDNAGRVAKENLELLLSPKFTGDERVASSMTYLISGEFSKEDIESIASDILMNPLIQRTHIIEKAEWEQEKDILRSMPDPTAHSEVKVETLDCSSVDSILELSKQRTLALSTEEADVIYSWFQKSDVIEQRKEAGLPEQPTDIELEVIAQTWSEHCKHKIFNATVAYEDENGNVEQIKSVYKSYVKQSTNDIRKALGKDDWCLSVFKDNAGVIKFNDDWSFVFKVETHNSPSALDPYGGALTGIVGVNRDPFGTGMGAKLLFNTDVFCFGSPTYDKKLPKRLLHPSRIYEGVRLGVEHGGNQSGIPTINGAIVFDDCFVGKPLVFCGTGGMMPAKHLDTLGHDKDIEPGELIVMCGGRIGLDGIHGATFSSVALDENSPVSAVQIGDPITQKRMFDFLWEAKEEGLYSCITDNGAGGLSSSVGEMAIFSGGCKLHLDKAPLKYQGLHPWEIFISEAQERMTLAVPKENIERFLELSKQLQVESNVLGEFTDSGYLEAYYDGKLVAQLEMEFLHEGLPPMEIPAKWTPPKLSEPDFAQPEDLGVELKTLLGTLNICSKESVIRQYDHEVQGGSVIKPLTGIKNDGPSDAAVIRPIFDTMEGIAVANGICPRYSAIDSYHMMACAIDEGIRNLVAVGTPLDQVAGLDNFCWPDPVESDHTPDGKYKMAQLIRANKALYEYAVGFGVPCISGKDSMKNDAVLDGQKISILPTVLFSTVGKVQDVRKCITMDVKQPKDLVYLIGETFDELGGSEYYHQKGFLGANVPKVNLEKAKNRYHKVAEAIQQGLVASNHDCSDGGAAVALAEIAFAGGYGLDLKLDEVIQASQLRADKFFFSESQSRFVLTVRPENKEKFEAIMNGDSIFYLGEVKEGSKLQFKLDGKSILDEDLDTLKDSWQATLKNM
ncbi:MAG: phosphoribosylformylglycinamidine synthase II [bacterium]|jgi:phosphoribosylformylglycinamidine synthase II